jgi:hypothetical protein
MVRELSFRDCYWVCFLIFIIPVLAGTVFLMLEFSRIVLFLIIALFILGFPCNAFVSVNNLWVL